MSQTINRASRQADGNTQFGFFFSASLGFRLLGEGQLRIAQWSSGKTVKCTFLSRRFEPQSAEHGAGANKLGLPRIQPPTYKAAVSRVTIRP